LLLHFHPFKLLQALLFLEHIMQFDFGLRLLLQYPGFFGVRLVLGNLDRLLLLHQGFSMLKTSLQ
jgi:hypothetical protein